MNVQIRKMQKSRWMLIIPFVLTAFTLYVFDFYDLVKPKKTENEKPIMVDENVTHTGYLIHTPGCRIPKINPFDPTIRKYYSIGMYVTCGRKRSIVESNQTSIWVVKEHLADYNVTNMKKFGCCYIPYRRKPVPVRKKPERADDKWQDLDTCVPFEESVHIYVEFIKIECRYLGAVIYKDYHAFVVPKTPSGEAPTAQEGISVLLLGADTISRPNFYRRMPRTRRILQQLKAVEFIGYNKVHDNTFPNLVPMLSGFSVEDIQQMCWFKNKDYFDHCPWIWKKFSANGYLTAYGEDGCWMGLFNYLKNGFLNQPTDYYLRPYIKRGEEEIGHSQEMNMRYCIGTRFAVNVLFDYAIKFVRNVTATDKKFWGYFWSSSLTHDYLNFPRNTDDIYHDLLETLNNTGVLNKTVTIFMSDHGIRWGSIRETFQGRMEERLPFLFVLLPEWFKRKYSTAVANMEKNTRVLTSHFDVHETMNDLIDLSSLEPQELRKRKRKWNRRNGISLFLPIPPTRTCEAAGILPEWCTCQASRNISKNDKRIDRAANVLVEHINQMLFKHIQCSHLRLKEIVSARMESVDDRVKTNSKQQIIDFVIIVVTTPGNGKFEATVRYQTSSKQMYVQSFISRINLYGDQGYCISDYKLRLYCYCA